MVDKTQEVEVIEKDDDNDVLEKEVNQMEQNLIVSFLRAKVNKGDYYKNMHFFLEQVMFHEEVSEIFHQENVILVTLVVLIHLTMVREAKVKDVDSMITGMMKVNYL
jgi:hypothetical protein